MLPPFNPDGVLPPGDYPMTFEALRQSLLAMGPTPPSPHACWDTEWRLKLIDNLEIMVKQLWQVGITDIFVDGSFAENKDHPNDIDGYFVCDFDDVRTGELHQRLNLLEPHKIWTWDPQSRRPYRGYPKLQLPMWHHYRVELYPHWGQPSGIRDQYGNEQTFPSAFRLSRRDGKLKGIIKIEGEL